MSSVLAVQVYPKGLDAMFRHWGYFERSGADELIVIGTTDGYFRIPEGATGIRIGKDSYLDGDHLPLRLVNTFDVLLDTEHDVLAVCEYDTVFFKPVAFDEVARATGAAAHLAGRKPWGAIGDKFYHNPWVLARETAEKFVAEGRRVIEEGICKYGSPESSPDVFFGLVLERLNIQVQENLWVEFSRNSLDCEGDLERARLAYRSDFSIIHGVKTESELSYITGVGITQEEDCTC